MLNLGLVLALALYLGNAEPENPCREQNLAQALGFQCQTQFGVCPIPPAPIGATCFCGNVPGRVVP